MPQLYALSWFKLFLSFILLLIIMISVMNCFFEVVISSKSSDSMVSKSFFWKW